MFIAAMLDALPELRGRVMEDLSAILPASGAKPALREGTSNSIRCQRFGFEELGPTEPCAADFRGMVALIEAARLSQGTAGHAVAILSILAQAEAHVHRTPVDQVHFHEIGEWDSLMDVVAAGSIAAALNDASWSVSPLPLGGGTISTRHGRLPVPAPATIDMLKGFSWCDDGIGGERVTPTGAAILRHLVGGERPDVLYLDAVGNGAGTRTLPDIPNILRAIVTRGIVEPRQEQVMVLSFEIDDMTGEEIGVAADRLRAIDGVFDLSCATRRGKKGRPLESFRLLVRPDALEVVRVACLTETSTIGLRWHVEDRLCLPRSTRITEGMRIKRVERPDGSVSGKVESDDLDAEGLAARRGLAARGEGGP